MNSDEQRPLAPDRFGRSGPGAEETLARLMRMRREIGITRVADLTGLDIIGIPGMQAVRPDSRSNSVTQGKGASPLTAAISAILECCEDFFSERNETLSTIVATASQLQIPHGWFEQYLHAGDHANWLEQETAWVEAQDLFSGTPQLVPAELVHTNFLVPQPQNEGNFVASTTGLAASFSADDAIIHAILECVERDAIARARLTHGFYQKCRIETATVTEPAARSLIDFVESKGMLVGLWEATSLVDVPVIWCHLMERDHVNPVLPFPADGSAASFSPAAAVVHAIYEAAQTRLAAISGAREDITRSSYPKYPDTHRLDAHRRLLREGPQTRNFASLQQPGSRATRDAVLALLAGAGIENALLVDFETSPFQDLSVVKVMIPQLLPLLEH